MDNDRDYRNMNKSDGVARTLAIIAIILSIIAMAWAAKANSKANDAMNKANSITVNR